MYQKRRKKLPQTNTKQRVFTIFTEVNDMLRMWLLKLCSLMIIVCGASAMQVQMTEDLTKEELAQRNRWLANPVLKCEICHKMVDEVYVTAERSRGTKKMEEIHIVEAIEDICKFDGAGGAWLRSVKIVENDPEDFEIEPITGVIFRSNCDVSCQTIYRMCAKMIEKDIDIDEFSGHMLKGGSKFRADEQVCTPICTKKSNTSSSSKGKPKKSSKKSSSSSTKSEL